MSTCPVLGRYAESVARDTDRFSAGSFRKANPWVGRVGSTDGGRTMLPEWSGRGRMRRSGFMRGPTVVEWVPGASCARPTLVERDSVREIGPPTVVERESVRVLCKSDHGRMGFRMRTMRVRPWSNGIRCAKWAGRLWSNGIPGAYYARPTVVEWDSVRELGRPTMVEWDSGCVMCPSDRG